MSVIVKAARVAGPLLAATLVVSACSGGAKTAGAVGPADTSSPSPAAGAGGGQGTAQARQAPGVSGLVADLQGSTLQVQSTSAQTTVTFSATTTFTDTTKATAADVKVGVCVTALPDFTQGAAAASPSTDGIAATTVTISQPVDGACTAGGFGGGGGRGALPSGAARPSFVRPSGGARPSGRRGGFGGGTGGFGGIASGTVASVTGTGFTVTETRRGQGASASATPTTVTVTTSSATTFTQTAPSTAKALATGTCVTALGAADSTGAVAATSIAIRPAVNGVCTQAGRGFGAGGFPGGPGGGAGAPGA